MKIIVELDLEDPWAEVRYLRAHASQIPATWKERADWFRELADQIAAQIPDGSPIRLTSREIADITEAARRHPEKLKLNWMHGVADLVDPPEWAIKWLRERRGSQAGVF